MASLIPLAVPQANDVIVALTVYQSDGVTPQDITGFTPEMVVKASPVASDASGVTLTAGQGLTITSAAGGLLTALLTRQMTAQPVPLWYRLDLVSASGAVTTAIEGPITVSAG